jgi:photosystem II stability/assembly factor-like uncharacterized protein
MSGQIVLGTRKGLLMLERSEGRWRPRPIVQPGVPVCFAARDPRSGTLWASLDHGHWGPKLSRSTDDGRTWADAPVIAYPEGARFVAQYMPLPGEDPEVVAKRPRYKDATLLKVWYLGFGGDDAPGTMHAGTIPGGLFTSRDGGESWELNRPLWNHASRGGDLFAGDATSDCQWGGTPAAIDYGEFAPGIHSVVVDPRDPRHLYVAASSAGVLESRDGGQTWAGCNSGMRNDYLPDPAPEWGHDPHYVVACAAQPDHLWQQNHCGVYYSDDGARTWRDVSRPELGVRFGFPIAADARDGRTAWVVPGRADTERMALDGGLFVARTEDGGQTWRQLRRGLPQEHAYDIVLRHALDASGDSLCFGSTTGNVYVSDDRGESWQSAGGNFPPVYSVRFC